MLHDTAKLTAAGQVQAVRCVRLIRFARQSYTFHCSNGQIQYVTQNEHGKIDNPSDLHLDHQSRNFMYLKATITMTFVTPGQD